MSSSVLWTECETRYCTSQDKDTNHAVNNIAVEPKRCSRIIIVAIEPLGEVLVLLQRFAGPKKGLLDKQVKAAMLSADSLLCILKHMMLETLE